MALTDSLISYWSLDETSGSALDAHGTNDLTDHNTVGSAAGKVSNARDFELSSSQFFDHADNADLSVGDIDFTVAAWVKLESKPADEMTIVAKSGGGDGDYFLSYTDNTDRFQFQVYAASAFGSPTSVDADNLGSPSTATWYFVVAWHDATANTINIQVNNGAVNSVSHTGGIIDAANTTFYVGGDPFANYFDGLIDEVGFWKRTLTTQERTDLYNSGNGLAYPLTVSATTPTAAPDDVTIAVAVTQPTVVYTEANPTLDPSDVSIAVAVTAPTVIASLTVDPADVTVAVAVTAPTVEYTEAPVPTADAYALSGPDSGLVDVASGAFTVRSNGTLAADVTITPSDGADGGTFTPSTVTLAAGDFTQAAFTYTPASTGAKTISVTNDGSLTDPGDRTFNAVDTLGGFFPVLARRRGRR